METLGEDGTPRAPELRLRPRPGDEDQARAVVAMEGDTAVVEWGGANVFWWRQKGVREEGESDCGDLCTYDVYAIPTTR